MTTELEEQFYKVFGIEPIAKKYECKCGTSTTLHNLETCKSKFCDKKYCDQRQTGVYYPEITDRKLLEMICIYNSTYTNGFTNYSLLSGRSIEELKGHILSDCLKVRDDVYNQIQQIFKEEE